MEDSNEQKQYIEDSTIRLPAVKDSINSLGDLWDCHYSKPVNFNLFSKGFKEAHVRAIAIDILDYSLTHIKTTVDKIKNVNVSGNMSIELVAGLIKVEGGALFDKHRASHLDEEQIICHYNLHTYSVDLLPIAKEVMDDFVMQGLMCGKIQATHVVRSVILGGEAIATLSIKKTSKDKSKNIEGNFMGKLPLGKVSASLKAKLQWLDSEEAGNYDKRITLHSKPAMLRQPVTVEDMFKVVEEVDKCIEKQKHFKILSDKIIGVPLGFILVPLSQFLDIKVEKLYLQLSETVLNDFQEMLINLQDFRSVGYLKTSVLVREPKLELIVTDSNSPLSIEIQTYEESMNQTAEAYFRKAYNALYNYKMGKVKADNLLEIITEFKDCSHNVTAISKQLENLLAKGKSELIGLHIVDSVKVINDIKIFTNSDSVNEWMRPEIGIRILMTTEGKPSEGAFRRLYLILSDLKKLGIKVGIASPSISKGFSIQLKVNGKLTVYIAEDVVSILRIISAIVGVGGEEIEKLFYSVYASLFKIPLPLKAEQLRDVDKIIDILKINYPVYIAESSLDTRNQLKLKDNKWRFYLPIECIDTVFHAVEKFEDIKKDPEITNGEWIIGDLGICGHHSAPILFLIRNGKVEAICFDNADLLLVVAIFKQNNDEPDFKILSIESLRNSFYPDRSRYAQEVVKLLHQKKTCDLNSDDFRIKSFDENPDDRLTEALDIARYIVKTDNRDVISVIARRAIKHNPQIEELLFKHGWNKGFKKFLLEQLTSELCAKLLKSLQEWLLQNNLQSSTYDETFETISNLNTEYIHLASLISLLHQLSGNMSDVTFDIYEILPPYIERLSSKLNKFKDVKQHLNEYVTTHQSFPLLNLLSKCQYDSRLFLLHERLDQMASLESQEIIKLLDLFSGVKFNAQQWADLWNIPKFVHIIRGGIEDQRAIKLIAAVERRIGSKAVAAYIPDDIGELLKDWWNKEEDLINPQLENAKKSEEIALLSKWWKEDDNLDENVEIINFSVKKIQSIIKKGFNSPGSKVYESPLIGSKNGLIFNAYLSITKNIEKLVLHFKVNNWGKFQECYCKLMLPDQSENKDKMNVMRILQVNNHYSNYYVSIVPLKLLTRNASYSRESFVANNGMFVKNDSIAIKMVFHPISYIYKSLSFKNGVLIWQISDYSNYRQDRVDGINSYAFDLCSPAFYTSEFGYKLRAILFLNGYPKCDTKYIAISIIFIPGEFDSDLPKTFSYKIRASLLNQKELGIEKEFIREFQYSPPNKVETDQIHASQKRCLFKRFVRRQPSFLKVDCLLLKFEVEIVDAKR